MTVVTHADWLVSEGITLPVTNQESVAALGLTFPATLPAWLAEQGVTLPITNQEWVALQ